MACDNNKTIECNCTFSCSKHGKCCECISYHNRAGEFPACVFSDKAEKSGDRSLNALINDRQG